MSGEMASEVLDALTELERTATPGPWDGASGDVETVPEFDFYRFDVMSETVATVRLNDADAALIAAMRNALPALIGAARELNSLRPGGDDV